MEKSFAAELYLESLKHSEAEMGPASSAYTSQTGSHDKVDELEIEDGSLWGSSPEELEGPSDLEREWKWRHHQFHTIGYRDGLIVGKEASAQEGFNIGFKESVLVGYDWGLVRGFTSAFSCLPEVLKEKLVETEEKEKNFQFLHESVNSLSTTDALKLFHDEIMVKGLVEQVEIAAGSSHATGSLNQSPSTLGDYFGKLKSLLHDTPAVEARLVLD